MAIAPLRYAGYEQSAGVANVVVDGSPNAGTVLVLSHWPGLSSPPGVEADTSCQMVFRYLDRGGDLHGAARTVTNNHFDQDGLAGMYPLTDPEDGMRRRAQLEGLAAAGDFGVAPDRTSARISMAVSALADPETSPLRLPEDYAEVCVVLYEHALAVLPLWLDDPARCEVLWAAEDAELDAAEAAMATGEVGAPPPRSERRSTAPSELTPAVATDARGPGSDLDPQHVATEVIRFLADAPPAWDPYPL